MVPCLVIFIIPVPTVQPRLSYRNIIIYIKINAALYDRHPRPPSSQRPLFPLAYAPEHYSPRSVHASRLEVTLFVPTFKLDKITNR